MAISGLLKRKTQAVIILCLTCIGVSASVMAELSCYPKLDKNEPQYIVAFGSLMQTAARTRKANRAEVEFPVWVRGYERGWYGRVQKSPQKTVVTVRPSAGKKFNGLLLTSDSSQINAIDRGDLLVCREQVDPRKLQSMTGERLPDKGQFWIYTVKKQNNKKPASKFPIQQYDVDVFLTGCLEQAANFKLPEFSGQCIRTTHGWSEHWTNDRDRPVGKLVTAKRPEVDKLLEQLEGGLYDRVREE